MYFYFNGRACCDEDKGRKVHGTQTVEKIAMRQNGSLS